MVTLVKYKTQILIGLAVLVTVIIIYWGYRSLNDELDPVNVPDDNVSDPTSEGEKLFATNIASNLYSEISAWKISADSQPFEELAQLSDRMLVIVYNTYLSMYGDSLTDKLENGLFLAWGDLYSLIMDIIIPRMNKLGLA